MMRLNALKSIFKKSNKSIIMEHNKYYQMMEVEIVSSITSDDIRGFALSLLNKVPEYFFTVPASSSGKYHPKNDLGEGGLVRHSISVERMLKHLLEPDEYFDFTPRQVDLLIVAALFHDCLKSGTQEEYEQGKYTKFLHPLYASNFIMTQSVLMGFDYNDALFISSAVISHMGQWNTSKNGPGKLPTPETPAQKALHLADYLASRKDINMEVEVEENDNELTPTEEVKE